MDAKGEREGSRLPSRILDKRRRDYLCIDVSAMDESDIIDEVSEDDPIAGADSDVVVSVF
jgi:hypothetical protein